MVSTTERQHRLRPATEALQDLQRSALTRPYRREVTASPPSETTAENTNTFFDMTEIMTATAPLEQDVYCFPKIEWIPDDEDETIYQQQALKTSTADDNVNTSSHHSRSSPSLGKRSRSRLDYHGLVRSKSLKSSLCYLADKSICHGRQKRSIKSQKGSWGQFVQNDIDEEERMLRKLALSHHTLQGVKSNLSDLGFLRTPCLIVDDEQKGLE